VSAITVITAITVVRGRAIALRGDDIDTDRIMPARFLRAVTFEGLEKHLFEDDRAADPKHVWNDPRIASASVLVVNSNFGCGSSREHAPQGLLRSGIRAMVGESFSEIFQGNSAMLGIPCFVSDHASIDRLQSLIEKSGETSIEADVDTGVVSASAAGAAGAVGADARLTISASVPPALRDGFLSGQWNPTAMLLDRFDQVRVVGSSLPYISGF
jgi:3-isopropylmalate/(R)-2-methylmalate dehydratase small subunit